MPSITGALRPKRGERSVGARPDRHAVDLRRAARFRVEPLHIGAARFNLDQRFQRVEQRLLLPLREIPDCVVRLYAQATGAWSRQMRFTASS
jgi:hypothetical protein